MRCGRVRMLETLHIWRERHTYKYLLCCTARPPIDCSHLRHRRLALSPFPNSIRERALGTHQFIICFWIIKMSIKRNSIAFSRLQACGCSRWPYGISLGQLQLTFVVAEILLSAPVISSAHWTNNTQINTVIKFNQSTSIERFKCMLNLAQFQNVFVWFHLSWSVRC